MVDTTPGDWDVTKVARLWDTLLTKYPKIDAAYFHNDDMALAAYNVMKARGRAIYSSSAGRPLARGTG